MKKSLLILSLFFMVTKVFSQDVPQKAYFKGDCTFHSFIKKNLVYPEDAIEAGIEGQIKIRFYVQKDGTVDQVRVTSTERLGFGCEEAAIEVVKKSSGMWEPAIIRGKPVKMAFELPVNFELDSDWSKQKRKADKKARKKAKKEAKKMKKASKNIVD